MYQEWESPSFTLGQLVDTCREFFESRDLRTAVEKKTKNETLLRTRIAAINETQTLLIEQKGKKIRLTFLAPSQFKNDIARLGSIFLTGWVLKAQTEKQRVLDFLEQQFWETLDMKLAVLATSESQPTTRPTD